MRVAKKDMLLYVVTDGSGLNGNLAAALEEIIPAGATFVQLRDKEAALDEMISIGLAVKNVTDRYNVPFVVNDNLEAAIAIDADGLHIGQGDISAAEARKRLGEGKILGVSVQTAEQAITAQSEGADYLGVGAVFSTKSKDDADSVQFDEVKRICEAVEIPVVAIGGISAGNISELSGLGLSGAAVISAIFGAEDKAAATRGLSRLAKEVFC